MGHVRRGSHPGVIPAPTVYDPRTHAPGTHGDFAVDHTQYDTTSIVKTIEQRYGLAPLSSRDAAVNGLANVFDAREANHGGSDNSGGPAPRVHSVLSYVRRAVMSTAACV